MARIFTTLLLFFFVGTGTALFAQLTAVNFTPKGNGSQELTSAAPIAQEDWTLYADEDNKLFYIDFESLKVNVSDIIVTNKAGEVVLKENVFNLPVNTIYELDCSRYAAGHYEVELRTFTGVIRKEIVVQ